MYLKKILLKISGNTIEKVFYLIFLKVENFNYCIRLIKSSTTENGENDENQPHIYRLKVGVNAIGRSDECDVIISNSVSFSDKIYFI